MRARIKPVAEDVVLRQVAVLRLEHGGREAVVTVHDGAQTVVRLVDDWHEEVERACDDIRHALTLAQEWVGWTPTMEGL